MGQNKRRTIFSTAFSTREALFVGASGAAAAWAHFASRPPMRVRVGLRETDELVPAHYQAAAFLAFAPFALAAARDLARGSPRRFAVVLATGALSIVRLNGAIPLSGHALFLGAAIAFEARAREEGSSARLALSLAAAVVTSAYKVAWNDAGWGAASALVGAAIGAVATVGR